MFNFYIESGLVALALFTAVWLLSLILKNSSIVDVLWGTGFVVVSWYLIYRITPVTGELRYLLSALVTIWGLRLSIRIFLRNYGHGEDFRYAAWREKHGRIWWWRSFLQVFLLQAVVLWIVSFPLFASHAGRNTAGLRWTDWLAVAVWTIGFIFEAGGDWQLDRFKSDPKNKGKILKTGLWRYTRHPNYFGDAVIWWGFFLFTIPTQYVWYAWISPLVMTFLLVKISGVKMLEKTMVKEKPGYADYIKSTSPFFPLPPKK